MIFFLNVFIIVIIVNVIFKFYLKEGIIIKEIILWIEIRVRVFFN